MSEINALIMVKLKKYPKKVQKIILKALELAEHNQSTVISENLEGFVRSIVQND